MDVFVSRHISLFPAITVSSGSGCGFGTHGLVLILVYPAPMGSNYFHDGIGIESHVGADRGADRGYHLDRSKSAKTYIVPLITQLSVDAKFWSAFRPRFDSPFPTTHVGLVVGGYEGG